MSMSDLREYKCPACGGAIEFDSKSQKMKCPYCDTEFELETLKELDAQMEREAGQQDDLSGWQTDAGGEWQEGETDGMNVSYRLPHQMPLSVHIFQCTESYISYCYNGNILHPPSNTRSDEPYRQSPTCHLCNL